MTTPQPNGENSFATNNLTPNSSSSFSWKETLYRSITRAHLHLPKSPNKKNWSYAKACDTIQIKYKLRGRRRKELNEDEKIWLIVSRKRIEQS